MTISLTYENLRHCQSLAFEWKLDIPPSRLFSTQTLIARRVLSSKMAFSVDTLAVISTSLAAELRNSSASLAPVRCATAISSLGALLPTATDI